MAVTFLSDLVTGLSLRGRSLLPWHRTETRGPEELCDALVSRRGEVSWFGLAEEIHDRWEHLDAAGQVAFLQMVARRFGPDRETIMQAISALGQGDDTAALYRLHHVSEPRAQDLIRRLNRTQDGTRRLVRMREALLRAVPHHPELALLDRDFSHLFASWFNRGFLELRPINWDTSAAILEKIIRYEAVHAIRDWDDLRRRIEPPDRRLFAFFHPQMPDEPLIFVEVALTDHVPGRIADLLAEDRPVLPPLKASTAVFYSISNCQKGLRGISFGNFLIKLVVERLRFELPNLRNFVTLSPVPDFRSWLDEACDEGAEFIDASARAVLTRLAAPGGRDDAQTRQHAEPMLLRLAARYFLRARDAWDRPFDSVARFHLGNGACLDEIHVFADLSDKGWASAHGIMVNYDYNVDLEANHEAYAERGKVCASTRIKALDKAFTSRMKAAS